MVNLFLFFAKVQNICNLIGREECNIGFIVLSQPAFTSSKLTVETLEKGVKYVQR